MREMLFVKLVIFSLSLFLSDKFEKENSLKGNAPSFFVRVSFSDLVASARSFILSNEKITVALHIIILDDRCMYLEYRYK